MFGNVTSLKSNVKYTELCTHACKHTHSLINPHPHTHTHREEACNAAAQAGLPVDSVVVVAATSEHVHSCYDDQVYTHEEVSKCQVAHEETGNRQLGSAAWQRRGGKRKVRTMSLTSTEQQHTI